KNYLYPGFAYGFGHKLENLIYLEFRRAGYEVYVGALRNKEVDFVAKKADKIAYIQCTYLMTDELTMQREYAPLLSIPDSYDKLIVSLDDLTLANNKGIQHIQAWRLAQDYLALSDR
ncbi:MAG: ATP-binding protein, partial [Bacteroides sp.]